MPLYYLTKDPAAALPNDWRLPGDPTLPPLPGGAAALAYRTAIVATIPPGGGSVDLFFGGGQIQAVWLSLPGARARITGSFSATNPGPNPSSVYLTVLLGGLGFFNPTPTGFEILMPPIPAGSGENYDFDIELCFTDAGVCVVTSARCIAVTNPDYRIPSPAAGPYTAAIPAGDPPIAVLINATDELTIVFGSMLAQLSAGQPQFTSV